MTDAIPILDRILAAKRATLAAERAGGGAIAHDRIAAVIERAGPCRAFAEALQRTRAPAVIAEFKRASPSRGPIRPGARVGEIVDAYVRGGASAISVVCDEHFEGSLDDLRAARERCELPILCKDFIVDRRQILAARQAGADAILLIVRCLPAPTLRPLVEFAESLGMEVLGEAHDHHEIDRAMSAGCRVVGVNARDLRTFEVDHTLPLRLRASVPDSFTYVAESGIETPEDFARCAHGGVDAVLVGSCLMAAPDPEAALVELRSGG